LIVAGAVEADHDAEAGQVVVTHAADGGEVLDAIGRGRHRGREQDEHGEGQAHRDPPQNGHSLDSARLAQPRRWVSLTSPRPVYSISASAMRDDGTVLSSSMSMRRTMPDR